MIYILEGLDGTGKTSFASELIKSQVFSRPMYVYFSKEDSYENTKLAWVSLIKELSKLNFNIIMDRSIISTIAYHFTYRPSKEYENFIRSELESVLNLDPSKAVFIHFVKVHDSKKLLEYANRVKSIRDNYHLLMRILREKGFNVIVNGGQKDFNLF
ncbi:putative thymidylate kinase [Acidianus bottle-shaped virus]|uniref:Putative thymidylate kinase n=1 Tax=Acidianus bottle-shaped virus (isolate Italy/Pozzuoli) TaxID=654911 RepID=KTHY_ABVP|nr:thymidylate kinase [Acidianus bottle-shaped virus]A4ZU96.1 RecName: Full=Putative thymidylate kinase; AltName: Full=dTMP kinase [Acidianus bottle-shaped virus (isolate Pozzuoli)]ABP73400.1 putative thymidylate kinase [Acidianus bottle-shaped virus]